MRGTETEGASRRMMCHCRTAPAPASGRSSSMCAPGSAAARAKASKSDTAQMRNCRFFSHASATCFGAAGHSKTSSGTPQPPLSCRTRDPRVRTGQPAAGCLCALDSQLRLVFDWSRSHRQRPCEQLAAARGSTHDLHHGGHQRRLAAVEVVRACACAARSLGLGKAKATRFLALRQCRHAQGRATQGTVK